MAGERLVLNPILDNSANSPLELGGADGSLGNGLLLMDHSYPFPPMSPQWVSSADTEGEVLANTHYGNRSIAVNLRVAEPSEGASTNLATNPKCAIDTTGWTLVSLVSSGRVALYGQNPDGIAGVGSDTAFLISTDADLDAAYLSATVVSGLTYTFSAYVYWGGGTHTVKLTQRNAAGTLKASSSTLNVSGWTRLSVTFAADSSAVWRFGLEQTGAGAGTTYITGAMVEQSSTVNTYFDGDTPGCAWSGTHHASSSTRPATRLYKITEDLQQAADRINRKGGVLMRVARDGEPIFFDVSECDIDFVNDNRLIHSKRTQATLTFTAEPFWRGVYRTLTDHAETTSPVARGTDLIPGGQVPGLGLLTIDEDQGVDQWWCVIGWRSENYSSAATNALFYEAESLTVLSDTTFVAGASGASGGGSNVARQTNLTTSYVAMLSTQVGGGSQMSHIGAHRVFARLYRPTSNVGAVSVAFEWGEGDLRRRSTSGTVNYGFDEREGVFTLADLGQVSPTKTAAGTQIWEGRVLAKSTAAGDEIDVDYIFFIPVDEGAGQVSALAPTQNPTSWSARDEFDQTAGALTGKTAPVGGVWAGAGDATDFTVETTGRTITRAEISDADANTGRYAISGVAAFTNQIAQADVRVTGPAPAGVPALYQGVFARYVDVNNWLMATLRPANGSSDTAVNITSPLTAAGGLPIVPAYTLLLEVRKRVAGTVTNVLGGALSLGYFDLVSYYSSTTYRTVKLWVDTGGRWNVFYNGAKVANGTDVVLATGGALASGKPGVYDACTTAAATTRNYDNFFAFAPAGDAAAFASQSLALYPDRVIRENSGGGIWSPVSKFEGGFPRLPTTGREDRTLETIVKFCRDDPATGVDGGIDDLSFQWQHAPRGITLPEPS